MKYTLVLVLVALTSACSSPKPFKCDSDHPLSVTLIGDNSGVRNSYCCGNAADPNTFIHCKSSSGENVEFLVTNATREVNTLMYDLSVSIKNAEPTKE